ncbi:MAG: MFS transporter, partial [Ignavibacteria bacterium]
MMDVSTSKKNITAILVISALGYFVDIYDLILFSIVRKTSLVSLGLSGSEIFNYGVLLINMQMGGMLIGGIIWGILGDKRGRISVLFGSIFLYSIANIANGFVVDVTQYAILRFIAG